MDSRFRVVDIVDQGDVVDVHCIISIPFASMLSVVNLAESLARMVRLARQRLLRRGLARVVLLPLPDSPSARADKP